MFNKLMESLKGTASEPRDQRVDNTIRLRKAYNNYVVECASNGTQPLPFEQWAKTQ